MREGSHFKMKRLYSLNLIIICVIIVSLFIFTKAICDDDDTLLDTPPHEGYSYYSDLFRSPLSQLGILFELRNNTVPLRQIISYLERQEKSPPVNLVIFVTA
jgi:hypothetical protein